MSSPASLPKEMYQSAKRGELQKVVKWLRKGGWSTRSALLQMKTVRPKAAGLLDSASVGRSVSTSPPFRTHLTTFCSSPRLADW